MNVAIYRTEPGVRLLPLVLLGTSVLSFGGASMMRWSTGIHLEGVPRDPRLEEDPYFWLALPLFQVLLILATILPLRTRVHEHELTWPVSSTSLRRTRILAVWTALLTPVLLASVIYLAVASDAVSVGSLLRASLQLGAALTLALFALFGYRKEEPQLRTVEAWGLGLLAALLIAVPIWSSSGVLLWAYLLLACVAGIYVLGLPAEFSLGSDAVARRDARTGFLLPRIVASPLHRLLLRSTLLRKEAALLFLLPVLIFIWTRTSSSFLMPIYFAAFACFQSARFGLNVTRGVSSWPLARGRVLPYLALPPLGVMLLALGLIVSLPGERRPFDPVSNTIDLQRFSADWLGGEGEYATHVRVPAHLWKLHRVGRPAVATAPWGETALLEVHPLFWGSPWGAVNPYDASKTSSMRFVAWQLERALTARRGTSLSAETLLRDFLGGDPEALASKLRLEGAPWKSELPSPARATRPHRNVLGGLVLGVTLLWTLMMALVLRRYTPPADRRAWRHRRRSTIIAGVVAGALFLMLVSLEMTDESVLSVTLALIHRFIDELFGSRVLLWVLVNALALGAAYAWLSRRFQRMEVPPPTKNGWTRKEMGAF